MVSESQIFKIKAMLKMRLKISCWTSHPIPILKKEICCNVTY